MMSIDVVRYISTVGRTIPCAGIPDCVRERESGKCPLEHEHACVPLCFLTVDAPRDQPRDQMLAAPATVTAAP